MKFKLNEYSKFILSEKFILNEASLLEAEPNNKLLFKYIDALKTAIPAFIEKVKNIQKSLITEDQVNILKNSTNSINSAADAINAVFDGTTKKDPTADTQSLFTNYSQVLNTTISALNNKVSGGDDKATAEKFARELKTFRAVVTNTEWDEKAEHTAKIAFDFIQQNVDKVLGIDAAATTDMTAIKNLDNTCTEAITECERVNQLINPKDTEKVDMEKLAGKLSNYVNIMDELNGAMKPVINFTVPSQVKNQSDIEMLQKALDNGLSKFKSIMPDSKEAIPSTEEIKSAEKLDWGELYRLYIKENKDKEFWYGDPHPTIGTEEDKKALHLGYYKAVWGDKAKAISELGIAFINTVKATDWGGFSLETNPILRYLKAEEINKYIGTTIKKDQFDIIYNAAADGILTKRDFTKDDSSTYGRYNIIFNANLYSADLSVLKRYLIQQDQLRKNESSLDGAVQRVWQGNKAKVLANVMYIDGSIDNMEDGGIDETTTGKFRSASDIEVRLKKIMPDADLKTKEAATGADVQDLINKANGDETTAKRLLVFLYNSFRILGLTANFDKLDKNTTETIASLYNTYNKDLDWETSKKFDSEVLRLIRQKNFSSQQIDSLLRGLAEVAKILK